MLYTDDQSKSAGLADTYQRLRPMFSLAQVRTW